MRSLFNRAMFALRDGAIVHSASVGRRCRLGSGTEVKPQAVINGSSLGQLCYVNRGAEIYAADVGPYCSIGQMAQIGPREHLADEITTCNELYDAQLTERLIARNAQRTHIGADVWVGARAVVMRGCTVGLGAIIGAGAVVTRDIPPYAISVGLPAKVVRLRFSEQCVADLITSRWWERPLPDIRHAVSQSGNTHRGDESAYAFLDALS